MNHKDTKDTKSFLLFNPFVLFVSLWFIFFGFLAPSIAIAQDISRQAPTPELRAALIEAANDSEGFESRFHAEVWLLDMVTRLEPLVPDEKRRLRILRTVYREAKLADLPPELVLAVIQVESRFQRYAVSWAGAQGLMQVMPFWVEEIGRPQDNLFDLDTNLRYGCTILRHYLDLENGDLSKALARYNGSVGEYWYPTRVQAALETRWYRQ
jgi:soluble lytic murein transglycosylase-like protein